MKYFIAIIAICILTACAASRPSDVTQNESGTPGRTADGNMAAPQVPVKPLKSPHGYIITKDYEPGRFGGFIGNCADDQNWPYYWQCLSENSGNGFK